MGLVMSVAPATEVISISELKQHLRLSTGSFSDEIASTVTIAPAVYALGSSTNGTGVDVLNKRAILEISVGTVAAGGLLDVHIEESLDNTNWTNWTGGIVPQISAAGTYELLYTGVRQYARAVGAVTVAAVTYSASFVTGSYLTDEDTDLATKITAAREICEDYQGRSYITRTYELTLDEWPCGILELPMPPALTITSIIYTDSAGTAKTWDSDEYQLDATGFVGRLSPAYGYSWPSVTLRELAGIKITYTAGYGATAASVPQKIRNAVKMIAGELYENRESSDTITHSEVYLSAMKILGQDRVISI